MTTNYKVAIWKRAQVAIIGFAIVSTSIFGASLFIEQPVDDQDLANVNLQQDIAETGDIEAVDETPTEPLAELGVTPVPKDEDESPLAEVAEPGANPVTEDNVLSEDEVQELEGL